MDIVEEIESVKEHDYEGEDPCVENSEPEAEPEDLPDLSENEIPKSETESEKASGDAGKDQSQLPEEKEDDGVVDVLGSGKLMKKTLVGGKGEDTRPQHGDAVVAKWVACLQDGTQVEAQDRQEFTVGDMQVINALDLCCAMMEEGEEAQITTDPLYAYGSLGLPPSVPGDVTLVYRVKVLEVKRAVSLSQTKLGDRLKQGDMRRERGNFFYERKDYSSAIHCYTRGLRLLDGSTSIAEEGAEGALEKISDLRLKCYCNMAAAQLKVGAYEAVIKSCDSVLRQQPTNIKALYRKAKATSEQGELPEAIKILKSALAHEPDNKLLHTELSRLVSKKKREAEKEMSMYKRMLGTENTDVPFDHPSMHWKWWLAGSVTAAALSICLAAYKLL